MMSREKEDTGPKRDVEIEGNSGSNGKGEWSKMARACVEEGWWACFEKSTGVWSEGQEKVRTTKEDVEDASGEGEQECWFADGGCLESSKMESGSWRDKTRSKLGDDDDEMKYPI